MILRNCIKEIVRKHLNDGYIAMGQCLTAVGWVGGTLPELYEKDGMIELSMADVAGGVSLLVQRWPENVLFILLDIRVFAGLIFRLF